MDDNLNKLHIPSDTGGEEMEDYTQRTTGPVSVYFRDIESHLCRVIRQAELVLGAAAWLTSDAVLTALAEPRCGAAVVVQKEDFLRPDATAGKRGGWAKWLHAKYAALRCDVSRYDFDTILGSMDTGGDPSISPVRCVGNHNREKSSVMPRMHNKFFVVCNVLEIMRPGVYEEEEDGIQLPVIRPYGVWTGSLNPTENATRSFENAVYITIPEIVKAYYLEWSQIMALSEPLDWSNPWCEPEWRVGT